MELNNFKNIEAIYKAFPDEETCLKHLELLRWNGVVISPFDPSSKVYSCKKNRYRCRNSGKYFNAKTDTLFYNSRIPLQKWFVAIWYMTTSEYLISSTELALVLKISQKSSWYMIQNIKEYFEIASKPKKKRIRKVKERENKSNINSDSDKLQLTDWLKLLQKQ
jgi:transposase-like protein